MVESKDKEVKQANSEIENLLQAVEAKDQKCQKYLEDLEMSKLTINELTDISEKTITQNGELQQNIFILTNQKKEIESILEDQKLQKQILEQQLDQQSQHIKQLSQEILNKSNKIKSIEKEIEEVKKKKVNKKNLNFYLTIFFLFFCKQVCKLECRIGRNRSDSKARD